MARRLARPYNANRIEAAFLSRCDNAPYAHMLPGNETLDKENLKDNLIEDKVEAGRRPRILAAKSLPDLINPLQSREVRAFLAILGPAATYGLRAIRLRQECLFNQTNLVFGEYVVPQEIHLYAVPPSPWRLPFVPCRADLATFEYYASDLHVNTVRRQTCIVWEPDGLREFFLYVVLAHEIGHHLLQYQRGKRRAQNYRRADHEAWQTPIAAAQFNTMPDKNDLINLIPEDSITLPIHFLLS